MKDIARVLIAGAVLAGVAVLAGSKNGTGLVTAVTAPYSSAISVASKAA